MRPVPRAAVGGPRGAACRWTPRSPGGGDARIRARVGSESARSPPADIRAPHVRCCCPYAKTGGRRVVDAHAEARTMTERVLVPDEPGSRSARAVTEGEARTQSLLGCASDAARRDGLTCRVLRDKTGLSAPHAALGRRWCQSVGRGLVCGPARGGGCPGDHGRSGATWPPGTGLVSLPTCPGPCSPPCRRGRWWCSRRSCLASCVRHDLGRRGLRWWSAQPCS